MYISRVSVEAPVQSLLVCEEGRRGTVIGAGSDRRKGECWGNRGTGRKRGTGEREREWGDFEGVRGSVRGDWHGV